MDALRFAHYFQCASSDRHLGFVRQCASVKVVALDRPAEEIIAEFKQRTRNYVRQAEKAGVKFEFERDPRHFLSFYNAFAQRSGLPRLPGSHYVLNSEAAVLTKATLDGRDLVMHSYIVDAERRRVRLAHSARSAADDDKMGMLIGNANRFLHHADMLHFKSLGIRLYDFGFYERGTTDQKMLGLNRFKDSFGGEVIEESSYMSLPLRLALAARDAWHRSRGGVPRR